MTKKNKEFISYVFPSVLIDLVLFLKQLYLARRLLFRLKSNLNYKYLRKSKEVYVLANGPSLNNFPVQNLFGKEVIVMNNFHLSPWKDKVNIVAHCIGEPFESVAWEDPEKIINGTQSHSYWLHYSNYKKIDTSPLTDKAIHYVIPALPPGLTCNKNRLNFGFFIPAYQTTAQMALMLAIYMGYSKIYLLGFDHDWLSNRNVSTHFYKESDQVKKSDLSIFSYYDLMTFVRRKWEIYLKIKNIAENREVKIINLSNPTYLDVFEFND